MIPVVCKIALYCGIARRRCYNDCTSVSCNKTHDIECWKGETLEPRKCCMGPRGQYSMQSAHLTSCSEQDLRKGVTISRRPLTVLEIFAIRKMERRCWRSSLYNHQSFSISSLNIHCHEEHTYYIMHVNSTWYVSLIPWGPEIKPDVKFVVFFLNPCPRLLWNHSEVPPWNEKKSDNMRKSSIIKTHPFTRPSLSFSTIGEGIC